MPTISGWGGAYWVERTTSVLRERMAANPQEFNALPDAPNSRPTMAPC